MCFRCKRLLTIILISSFFLASHGVHATTKNSPSVEFLDGPVKIRTEHSSHWQRIYEGQPLPPLADVIVPDGARIALSLPGQRTLHADEWTFFSTTKIMTSSPAVIYISAQCDYTFRIQSPINQRTGPIPYPVWPKSGARKSPLSNLHSDGFPLGLRTERSIFSRFHQRNSHRRTVSSN